MFSYEVFSRKEQTNTKNKKNAKIVFGKLGLLDHVFMTFQYLFKGSYNILSVRCSKDELGMVVFELASLWNRVGWVNAAQPAVKLLACSTIS